MLLPLDDLQRKVLQVLLVMKTFTETSFPYVREVVYDGINTHSSRAS